MDQDDHSRSHEQAVEVQEHIGKTSLVVVERRIVHVAKHAVDRFAKKYQVLEQQGVD